eukprot:290988-Rhodomonas_salina.1
MQLDLCPDCFLGSISRLFGSSVSELRSRRHSLTLCRHNLTLFQTTALSQVSVTQQVADTA